MQGMELRKFLEFLDEQVTRGKISTYNLTQAVDEGVEVEVDGIMEYGFSRDGKLQLIMYKNYPMWTRGFD